MKNLKKQAIQLFEQAHNFTTKKISDDDYSSEWEVKYQPNLEKIYNEVVIVVKQLEDADKFYDESRLKDLIKIGKILRQKLFQLKTIHKNIEEISATNMGGASFNDGKGIGYSSKKFLKKHPKLTVKKLFEQTDNLKTFQEERIKAFDDIETRINNLLPVVSNAKNDTVEYYSNNPKSFNIYKSTEMVLNYLKKIEDLLKQNN